MRPQAMYQLIPKLNAGLIASAALLAGYLVYSLVQPFDYSRQAGRTDRAARPRTELRIPAAAGPVFAEGTFKAKYLFSQPAKKANGPVARQYVLLGISVGTKDLAMIRDVKNKKDYYCGVGDMVADYRVLEIHKDRVVLESADGLLEIGR